jgi:hypothetical protein
METKSWRAVGAIVDRVRILLAGLHAVNLVVVRIELVVIQLVINYSTEQDENGKPNDKISEVDQRKNLVMPYVSENVYKKMCDHGFETVNCFCFLFPEFPETVPQH